MTIETQQHLNIEGFGIIEEFYQLSHHRKKMLSAQLLANSDDISHRCVRSIWPHASLGDMKKLKSFIILLKYDGESKYHSKSIH